MQLYGGLFLWPTEMLAPSRLETGYENIKLAPAKIGHKTRSLNCHI
jgi:hypothetical protein